MLFSPPSRRALTDDRRAWGERGGKRKKNVRLGEEEKRRKKTTHHGDDVVDIAGGVAAVTEVVAAEDSENYCCCSVAVAAAEVAVAAVPVAVVAAVRAACISAALEKFSVSAAISPIWSSRGQNAAASSPANRSVRLRKDCHGASVRTHGCFPFRPGLFPSLLLPRFCFRCVVLCGAKEVRSDGHHHTHTHSRFRPLITLLEHTNFRAASKG